MTDKRPAHKQPRHADDLTRPEIRFPARHAALVPATASNASFALTVPS